MPLYVFNLVVEDLLYCQTKKDQSGRHLNDIAVVVTLTPHRSVASSKASCITFDMDSLSDKISARLRVPRTFLSVVAAKRRVE